MSITIDLPKEIYERLEKQAQARGTTIAEAVAQALEEAESARISAFWERMEEKGLVAKRNPAPPASAEPFQPIEVQDKPLAEANRRAAIFEQMRAEGILLPKKPAQPGDRASFEPIEVRGRPVSEILVEERR